MIEPGRGGAYAVLFSEIGISLLITTLLGVLVGYWADEQLGTLPIFVLVGFLAGAGAGMLMIYRLVRRFLKTIRMTPPTWRTVEERARRNAALLCVEGALSSEQVAPDEVVETQPAPPPRSGRPVGSLVLAIGVVIVGNIAGVHRGPAVRPRAHPEATRARSPAASSTARSSSPRRTRSSAPARARPTTS